MAKFALVAVVGADDPGVTLDNTYFKSAQLCFNKHNNAKDVSIHGFLKELKRLRLRPSELTMDLLVIACTMYAADTRIKREHHGEDSWTRVIDLYIPVSDEVAWQKQKEKLEKIFRFLTGDIWTIFFRKRTDSKLKLSPVSKLNKFKMPYKTNTVCLFSGGMDSFIGAINLLENGTTPLLVGHSKSADVGPYQKACADALKKEYSSTAPEKIYAFIKIPKENLFDSEDHTERGRSFMFLTLGSICASALGKSTYLYIPENGMISLNIPLTPLRVGSHSTRTTHPYYIGMMQDLLSNLGLGVQLVNPFQFKTKGEMMSECKNLALVEKTETMSCSHPSGRYEGLGNGHCGYCVPCIIRKASYLASKATDNFAYRKEIVESSLQISKAEGADVLAFKYMIEKVNSHPNYLKAAIRLTGPLTGDIDDYINVYTRALKEVDDLLAKVKVI